jgi:signal transduction histidine kinase
VASAVGATRDAAARVVGFARQHPQVLDAVVAVLFAVAALYSTSALFQVLEQTDPTFDRPGTAETVISMLGVTLPLAWRRRFPLSAVATAVAVFILARAYLDVEESAVIVLATWLAIYSGAVHGRRPWRTPVLAAAVAVIMARVVYELFWDIPELQGLVRAQSFQVAYNAVLVVLPWALGAAIRSMRERQREVADRAAELQRQREENARRAVFDERVRIARELHDVVAHHVSVMGIQAGAARRVMARTPEKAEEALSSIESASRHAVVELHRMLGFLRQGDEGDALAPQPGLAQLDELAEQLGRQASLAVDVRVEGEPRPLPQTLEVSVYRIVQEALTNTLKHANAATATVSLRYEPALFEVEVTDDGRGGAARTDGTDDAVGGHGLIGMRERASLHGGHLRSGPRSEGGFSVHATFPLNGPAP